MCGDLSSLPALRGAGNASNVNTPDVRQVHAGGMYAFPRSAGAKQVLLEERSVSVHVKSEI